MTTMYANILHALTSEPWPITAEGMNAIVTLLGTRLGWNPTEPAAFGMAMELPEPSKMRMEDGIATIPVVGVLGRGLSRI